MADTTDFVKPADEKYSNILKLMIDKPTNYNIYLAALEGHMEIVKLIMLEKGVHDYERIMWSAASRGHMEIVKLMLEKGANDYDLAMGSAALGGHMDMVKFMLEKGANNYESAMEHAASGGHIEIVKLMLEKGANYYNWVMNSAAKGGHMNIVKLLLEKGANNYDSAIDCAAEEKHDDIVKLLQEHREKNKQEERIVEIKTSQAQDFMQSIKTISRVVSQCTIEFTPGIEGRMKIRGISDDKGILVKFNIPASEFDEYYCKEKLAIGVNMNELYGSLELIKDDDQLIIYMIRNNPLSVFISIKYGDSQGETHIELFVNDANLQPEISVPVTEFPQKIMMSTETPSGAITKGIYKINDLLKISKCTELCRTINIYQKNDFPLVFALDAAKLGKMYFFLAPMENIPEDKAQFLKNFNKE